MPHQELVSLSFTQRKKKMTGNLELNVSYAFNVEWPESSSNMRQEFVLYYFNNDNSVEIVLTVLLVV